ncbi:site-specific DNA recombinase [Maritimibacter alkaliphilus HTCC2654]|uniref:Site-specific recombinase and resolvase superfamily protein n=1 Tax=Maritimibacter alkaliphilus HTCC2654 TaxID=314271 RepID=A3V9X0_9RHOB|nr:recombinase family protein [Maritimibacter alkaliphilus]EAQ14711.1 Site-specific recombinase and resolvase superfamily protein [Maritimibacter alkaliphilus HTCC2654]TYP81061.1 site-specific DNA recombinase [Maritimibacter alkaliphilus HTCC2654]
MTKRAVIYARYSTGKQKQTSIADQVAMCERHCENAGWEVVGVFSDSEKTGKRTKRPGLQEMIEMLRCRKADVVLIEAVDRLHRSVVNALSYFEITTFRGIELYSVSEGQQDFIKLLFNALGAQYYSDSVAVHTRRALESLVRKQGRTHGMAFGYRKKDGETGLNREPDPETAWIVTRIFEETAAGHSAEQIAQRLNQEGIPAPKGGDWYTSTLRGNKQRGDGILRNRIYIGEVTYGATKSSFDPETGKKWVEATPDQATTLQVEDLRIIPQPLWDAAHTQLEATARQVETIGNASAAHRTKYLLSGLLVCGCCGRPFTMQAQGKYYCRNKKLCGNRTPVLREAIEQRVFASLRDLFLTPELEAKFDATIAAERRKMASASGSNELRTLIRRKAEAEKAITQILRAIESGTTFKSLLERAQSLEDEIARLELQINKLEAVRRSAEAMPTRAAPVYAAAIERMETLLADPDFVHQASGHLAQLIRSIRLTPDHTAQDGMSAEVHMDLGSWVLGAGYSAEIAARFSNNPQMTIEVGAAPPT